MIDGFFNIVFTGASGSGFGVLVFSAGIIVGADASGAIYDGKYMENISTGEITIHGKISIPGGAMSVQNGIPLAAATTVHIDATMAKADMLSQKIVLLQTALGPINVIYKKIRDFPYGVLDAENLATKLA